MGKNSPWKRWMISLTDEGIIEIFDSPSTKTFSPPATFSDSDEFFNVDPSFVARLNDFIPEEDVFLVFSTPQLKNRNLTFWYDGDNDGHHDVFHCPISCVKGVISSDQDI